MEELYKFMNQSNATLDLKVGNELATEAPAEGEPAEVCKFNLFWHADRQHSACSACCFPCPHEQRYPHNILCFVHSLSNCCSSMAHGSYS